MFLLKKILGSLLSPIVLAFLLLMLGVFQLWFRRDGLWGRRLTTAGVVLLLGLSYGIPFSPVLRHLESRHPPVMQPEDSVAVRWIVVLGGGHRVDSDLPVTSRIGASSIYRVVEGVRIYRSLQDARMVFSGGAIFNRTSAASVGAELAVTLGVDPSDVTLEEGSRATAEEAQNLWPLLQYEPFFLVTSAAHMPRAVFLFRNLGMNPIPAPTQHRTSRVRSSSPNRFLPSWGRIVDGQAASHEVLGITWAWIRGVRPQ